MTGVVEPSTAAEVIRTGDNAVTDGTARTSCSIAVENPWVHEPESTT
jgi:hypothetical protein